MRSTTILTVLLGAACGGGGAAGPDAGDDTGPDAAPGDPFGSTTGEALVVEYRGDWNGDDEPTSAVSVTIADGRRAPFHRETAREGECRLLRFEPAPCQSPCDGVCTSEGCVAFPTHLDAGATLSITGTSTPLSVDHDDVTHQYWLTSVPPVDLFTPGTALELAGPGGADVPAFAVATTAPAPLVTPIVSPLSLIDADTELTWTPEPAGGAVFLTISSANVGHGAPYDAVIECASPDDGSVTVPGAFIAALGDLSGFPCLVGHECPPATLVRYHRGTTATPAGTVTLRAAAGRLFYVSH
jgi:hypothetical protein